MKERRKKIRRRGPPAKNEGGFALVMVILVLALVSVVSLIVVDVVNMEQRMIGYRRVGLEARALAEAGATEILNDSELAGMLPGFDDPALRSPYVPSSASPYYVPAGDADGPPREYNGMIYLVRTEVPEGSDMNTVNTFVYEIQVDASINQGQASDRVVVEVFKAFANKDGTVLPQVYAR